MLLQILTALKQCLLNFTPDEMIYRGNIVANFPELNMDALNGEILVTNSLLVQAVNELF